MNPLNNRGTKAVPTIFYVHLDALLDTRYGTLVMLDPLVIPELAKNKFWHRISDEMHLYQSRVSKEAYDEAWKNRTEEVLPHSLMTMMVIELAMMVLKAERLFATSGDAFTAPEVVINVHPYVLSDKGKENIGGAIMARAGFMTRVTIIDEPEIDISPTVMKQREYSHVIMYNYDAWFKHMAANQPADRIIGCPQIQFFLPQLGNTEEEVRVKQIELKTYPELPDDLFSLFQATMADVAAVRFSPAELFSVKLTKD